MKFPDCDDWAKLTTDFVARLKKETENRACDLQRERFSTVAHERGPRGQQRVEAARESANHAPLAARSRLPESDTLRRFGGGRGGGWSLGR